MGKKGKCVFSFVIARDLSVLQLITVKKTTSQSYPSPFDDGGGEDSQQGDGRAPAHRDFRDKYFKGFKKDGTEI